MKTVFDYHKKVLGLSLKGRVSQLKTSNTQERSLPQAGPFCFLCDQSDFEQNEELVLKILKAAGVGIEILVFDTGQTSDFREVFSFGVYKEKALSFESFSTISKQPELKRKLWAELKKRS